MGLPQRIITFVTCVYFIIKFDVSFRHYSQSLLSAPYSTHFQGHLILILDLSPTDLLEDNTIFWSKLSKYMKWPNHFRHGHRQQSVGCGNKLCMKRNKWKRFPRRQWKCVDLPITTESCMCVSWTQSRAEPKFIIYLNIDCAQLLRGPSRQRTQVFTRVNTQF
jgi:hypothetical protein